MDALSPSSTLVLPDYIKNFSADAYCKQNYTRILPEDRLFIESLTKGSLLSGFGLRPDSFENTIDIGNAGALLAPALMAPFVKKSGKMVLADVADPQVSYIADMLRDGKRGHLGMWQKFEDLFSQSELWDGALHRACQLGEAQNLALKDLQPASYDAGSMMYVSESINKAKADFERDTKIFFDAIRPNGLVLWACMIGSEGYNSPGHMFDAVWIDLQDMTDAARVYLKDFKLFYSASSQGMRPKDGPGYLGAGLVAGIKA